MARDTIAEARQQARALVEHFAVRVPPVPVEKMARQLGVRIQFAPLDDELSGMAFVKDGVPIIGVNALHHPNRQRFTLAHELGHIRLHRPLIESEVHVDKGSLRRDTLASTGTDITEREANAFAAELLMPKVLLDAVLGERALDLEDDDGISALAKKFRVSEAAMRFRLHFRLGA